MRAEQFFRHPLGMIGAATFSTFLWGSAFPAIKLSYHHLHIDSDNIGAQFAFASHRFLLASVLILLFFYLLRQPIAFRRETLPTIAKISLFQTFLQYVLFYIGLSLSTGIQGSIIAGTTSLFQMLFAHFMYKNDHLTVAKMGGIVIGFTGVILVSLTKGSLSAQFGIGEWCLLLAMAAGAFGNILAKNGASQMGVAYLTSYQMLFGAIGLLLVSLLFSHSFMPFTYDAYSFGLLLYLACLSAVGFVIWNNVMKYNAVGKVSMYLFLIPVFGALLSTMLLAEPFHFMTVLGLMAVTCGIVIVNRAK